MLDKLEKHHLGFIVPLEEKDKIEQKFGNKFHYDAIQKTHVMFVYDSFLRCYVEYICREGRAARLQPGFAHICYNLKDLSQWKDIEDYIQNNKLGYQLTELEKSASKECGWITFYYLKNQGVIEFNIQRKE